MTSIPKNNLRERVLKLGYNPNSIQITIPIIDNSKVVIISSNTSASHQNVQPAKSSNFTPPVITNIEEWSDFEDE